MPTTEPPPPQNQTKPKQLAAQMGAPKRQTPPILPSPEMWRRAEEIGVRVSRLDDGRARLCRVTTRLC